VWIDVAPLVQDESAVQVVTRNVSGTSGHIAVDVVEFNRVMGSSDDKIDAQEIAFLDSGSCEIFELRMPAQLEGWGLAQTGPTQPGNYSTTPHCSMFIVVPYLLGFTKMLWYLSLYVAIQAE